MIHSELLEVVDAQRKRLKRLKNKYVRQGSKTSSETEGSPPRPSSRSHDNKANMDNLSAVTRENTRTAVRSDSRPTTPGSLKRYG